MYYTFDKNTGDILYGNRLMFKLVDLLRLMWPEDNNLKYYDDFESYHAVFVSLHEGKFTLETDRPSTNDTDYFLYKLTLENHKFYIDVTQNHDKDDYFEEDEYITKLMGRGDNVSSYSGHINLLTDTLSKLTPPVFVRHTDQDDFDLQEIEDDFDKLKKELNEIKRANLRFACEMTEGDIANEYEEMVAKLINRIKALEASD